MGPFTESIRGDLAAAGLMPDPLPGHSSVNSRGDGVDPSVTRRSANLDPEAADFMMAGGWSVVSIKDGGESGGGLTSHRGVLHPDEYVDEEALALLVADYLGFGLDEIRSVYRQGRKTEVQVELRGRIDARMLEVVEAGGSAHEMGRALGWPVTSTENCQTVDRALARARAARGVGGSE